MDGWKSVVRRVHLQGGIRAINGMNPKVSFETQMLDSGHMSFVLPSYGALFAQLEQLGIQSIGCDFMSTRAEAEGSLPPEWRSISRVSGVPWLCGEQGDKWSFIAHGAFKNRVGALWDISERISHQLRACDWRLRQLSDSYCDQLRGYLARKEFKDGVRFADGYTRLCYLALQAFVVDACVLRDYLAEFYAWVVAHGGKPICPERITSMGALAKRLRVIDPTDALGLELKRVTASGEWLHELGAFRDLIVHVAPLADAGRSFFAVARVFGLAGGRNMPGIKLPIPNNPTELFKERNSGRHFDDPNMDFARFSSVAKDHAAMRDGLEYAHDCLRNLSMLSASAAELSPVPGEIPQITAADVIGPIKVTRGK